MFASHSRLCWFVCILCVIDIEQEIADAIILFFHLEGPAMFANWTIMSLFVSGAIFSSWE